MITLFVSLTLLYLVVSFVGGAAYHDFTSIRPRPSYVESWAMGMLWPIVVPVAILKGILKVGRTFVEVLREVPNAVIRLWQA